jgi:YYY domain-containing protein
VVGALRAINTWDYPTYLGLTGAAIVLKWSIEVGEDHRSEPFDWHEWLQLCLRSVVILLFHVILILVPFNLLGIQVKMELAIYLVLLFSGVVLAFYRAGKVWSPYTFVHKFGWHFLSILVLTVLLFLPYILNYATGYVSVELWRDVRTTLNEYVTVHGIFLFIITSFFAVFLLNVLPQDKPSGQSGFELTDWAVYLVPLLVLAEIALILLKLPILALVLPLLGLGLWIILHPDIRIEATWVTLLSITGILLTLLVEVIVLKGDVGRTNTVFKFYLQAWVLFGVAGAVGLGLIMEQLVTRHKASTFSMVETPAAQTQSIFSSVTSRKIRWAWWSVFSLLILAGMVYPFAATRAKMNDRYVANSPPSLNGMDYMHQATYNENNQELVLRWDYEAIQWMRQNIKGSPVVMEGNTGLYRWGNRYSIYTGLPTVIGWDWHTKQQYSLLPGTLIDYRIELVREFYSTPDQNRAMEIARRYDVLYVIVGGLERAVYDAKGLNKFDDASDMWKLVYQNEQVKIYQVQ